ncbi:MAG TPA: hypothetical protein VFX23_10880 [Limnobacter sp.]|uniref:hypothetical protein n=1 Tax=Limnobacter sp. TaxID=2003368 RepID=UPI002E32AFDD|nr:hypothetical protein [Limnobacter sp.]HEX5486488.1 hypothetical protein [Limnobacter sp.]
MEPITMAMGLAQFAPQIIKWITGSDRASDAARHVAQIAQQVTGKQGADALEVFKADPQKVLEFRQAVLAQEVDLDKAYLTDRADARRRDLALEQAGIHNTRANLMVAMDVVGLIACLVGMIALGWVRAKHPEAISEGVFGALLAQLSTFASYFGLCLRDAHQFEFGSSRGSKQKDLLAASGWASGVSGINKQGS